MSPSRGAARVALAGSVALLAGACADAVSPARREAVRVVVASPVMTLGAGDTARLEASVIARDGGTMRDRVRWRTLHPAKASIDAPSGIVVALDTGTARLVATSGALADTTTLTITRRVASIRLDLADSILVGMPERARATALDAAGQPIPGAMFHWSSSDTTVIAVADTGLLTTREQGTTRLRVVAGSASAERTVRGVYRRLALGFTPQVIGLGDAFGCALDPGGRVHCWGWFNESALGRTDVTFDFNPIAPVASDERFVQLEVETRTACAVTAAGRTFCWGPHAAPFGVRVPTALPDSAPTRAVSLGASVGCALGIDDIARCWGRNSALQAGFAPVGDYPQPRVALDSARLRTIAVGAREACGTWLDGVTRCWGEIRMHMGGLGPDTPFAVVVPGVPEFAQLALVNIGTACGRTESGAVWCWGSVHLGPGYASYRPPTRLTQLPPMRTIVGSRGGMCGLTDSGEAWCWDANLATWQQPARWAAPYRFRQVEVSLAPGRQCGITTDDQVICTGFIATP